MMITKETSPHIRKKASAWSMMLDVIIALLPVVIFSIVIYGLRALMIIGISSFTMVAAEFVYVGLRYKMPNDGEKHSFKEKFTFAYKGHYKKVNVISPLVSALIFSMIMPANATWYACFIGSLFGIVLGKLVFGGLGTNIFNPAALGMVVAKLAFASSYPSYSNIVSGNSWVDVSVGGTPLTEIGEKFAETIAKYDFLDLFLGKIGGTLGETCSLLIIIGALYLIIRRNADFRPMLAYLGSFIGLTLVAGLVICNVNPIGVDYLQFVLFEVFTGGLLFGVAFMITDPVTSPITSPGRVMYGVLAGVLTLFIRFFGALPEGVAFSILISNMFVPVIDYYKWSSSKYTWKKILATALIFIIPCIIMVIALLCKKDGFWYA